MGYTLPISFRAAPLPNGYKGTPQAFMDAIVERLSADTQDSLALFASGATPPTSNVGPWLKDGATWYVWNDSVGGYVPQPLNSKSLRYVISDAAPSNTDYDVWIDINSDGKSLAVKTYSGGAWKDVYEDKFSGYSTTAQMNTAISAAITAAIPAAQTHYPTSASFSLDQNINADGDPHKLNYASVVFDPQSAYDAPNCKFVAPVAGYYFVTAQVQVDNNTATASGMELAIKMGKNGNTTGPVCYSGQAIASPPGSRWYPQLTGIIQAAVGDVLEVYLTVWDGVGTGNVKCSNGFVSFHLIDPV